MTGPEYPSGQKHWQWEIQVERTGQGGKVGKRERNIRDMSWPGPQSWVSGVRHPDSLTKDLFVSEERMKSPAGPLLLLDHQLEL